MKRFHSHNNGTAWTEEKVYFVSKETGIAISHPKTAGYVIACYRQSKDYIEIHPCDLPYLKKPEGDWEFMRVEKGDVFKAMVLGGGTFGHGKDEIASFDIHSGLQGYRWCKPRKVIEDRRWFELVMNDRPYIEKLDGSFRFTSFNDWWLTHGSGMPLLVNEDDAEHTERMCRMAWYAGFSKGGRK